MSTPLITLNAITLAFGHHALLDKADLMVSSGERIGLIGRNGAGKSSLLKLIAGQIHPDDGEIKRASALKVETVQQEPELDESLTIFELLSGDYLEQEDWQRPARANMYIDELELHGDSSIKGLSGGMRKRVALARALVNEPDLLLLDEPTNHLDFEGISWLENVIKNARCSVILITHDRRFLDNVANRIIELELGRILSFPGNFTRWSERKAEWLAAEALEHERADKLLAQEEAWIRKGVRARRARNEGRVRRLEQLRRERSERRERQGNVSMAIAEGRRSGKVVVELENIKHGYGDKLLIKDFSTTIMRKDRIGLIGPNGSGKTTLLKIILGKITPDSGTVKLGTNITVGYFDQMRAQLDEEATVAETINPGSEWVEIGTQRKHVTSYLEDFLFSPKRSQSPVKSLSGGERARLALARMFTQPANILVLDEPTNDLDIETLELLEELLQEYDGTVLLVSHDREFLNNVVTQTIATTGDGLWREFVGGYDDWTEQLLSETPSTKNSNNDQRKLEKAVKKSTENSESKNDKKADIRRQKTARITSWEQRELDELPLKIAEVEQKQAELAEQLSDPDLYKNDPDQVEKLNNKNIELSELLEKLFDRWEELEEKSAAGQQ